MSRAPLSDLMRRASQALNAAYLKQEPPATLPQALVLRTLVRNGPMNHTMLGQASGMDRSTLTEILRRMAALGVVIGVRFENDRRNVMVSITPKGRSVLLKVDGSLSDAEARILKLVPAGARAAFRQALQAIAEGAEA